MSRQLAHCPYCKECTILLNESFRVVFNSNVETQGRCGHFIWASGRCCQWEPILYGTARNIGSTAIDWHHPGLNGSVPSGSLLSYVEMLVQSGLGWEFAPIEPFQILRISEEESGLDLRGKAYPAWEADGWAVFAPRPREFLAAIVECRERQWNVCKEMVGQRASVSLPAELDIGSFGSKVGRRALDREVAQSVDRWRDDGGQG